MSKKCVCPSSNDDETNSDSELSKIISKFATQTESNLSLKLINRDDDSLNSFSSALLKTEKSIQKMRNNEKYQSDEKEIKSKKKFLFQKNRVLKNVHKNINLFKTFPQASFSFQ